MSTSAVLPFEPLGNASLSSGSGSPLSGVPIGGTAVVWALEIEEDVAAWLRAVGISEGERVTVLRAAAFGGPIHVRTSSGGEFALHRSLAAAVRTRALPRGEGESEP